MGDFGVFKKGLIVFYYYETRIAGNPNSRILKINNNVNSSRTKYEKIKLEKYDSIEFIDFSNLKANCNSIPKNINYNGIEYKLNICK